MRHHEDENGENGKGGSSHGVCRAAEKGATARFKRLTETLVDFLRDQFAFEVVGELDAMG